MLYQIVIFSPGRFDHDTLTVNLVTVVGPTAIFSPDHIKKYHQLTIACRHHGRCPARRVLARHMESVLLDAGRGCVAVVGGLCANSLSASPLHYLVHGLRLRRTA